MDSQNHRILLLLLLLLLSLLLKQQQKYIENRAEIERKRKKENL